MIGIIAGDIVGSRFEWNNYRGKDFKLFTKRCRITDDSVMALAIAQAIIKSSPDRTDLSECAISCMQDIGRAYPAAGYGGTFRWWLLEDQPTPYHSYGNGAAMRVGACGFAALDVIDVKQLSLAVTKVSHDHTEGIKGAEATAMAIFLARKGYSIKEIKKYIDNNYYEMNFTLHEIQHTYKFDVSCMGSVPQALQAFFESHDYEDALRNAVSIGGDSDTIAAIAGGVAEAYYDVPKKIRNAAEAYLDEKLLKILRDFESKYQNY